MTRLQVIGGGRMGEALVRGLLSARWCEPAALRVVETDGARRSVLAGMLPGVAVEAGPGTAEGTVVATKPPIAAEVVAGLGGRGGRLLSIAAGVTLATLERAAGAGVPVVRAMPNTPALVGEGVAAIAGGRAATADDLDWAETLLASVGTVVRVPESLLDAVTAVSGSGPAYVFAFVEALTDAGVAVGLPPELAATLAERTLVGSARLLASGDEGPASLRAAVTSPGGTTEAGLEAMADRGLPDVVVAGVRAACDRSRELGA